MSAAVVRSMPNVRSEVRHNSSRAENYYVPLRSCVLVQFSNSVKIRPIEIAFDMCEDKIAKMKRDVRQARRRARRLRGIHEFMAHPVPLAASEDIGSSDSDASSERASPKPAQRMTPRESVACLRDVAARTVALMRRNEEIQRRVLELKRETAAYLDTVMSDPDNQKRFYLYLGTPTPFQTPPASDAYTDSSSVSGDDLRSLPDTENTNANDSYDVELKVQVRCTLETDE